MGQVIGSVLGEPDLGVLGALLPVVNTINNVFSLFGQFIDQAIKAAIIRLRQLKDVGVLWVRSFPIVSNVVGFFEGAVQCIKDPKVGFETIIDSIKPFAKVVGTVGRLIFVPPPDFEDCGYDYNVYARELETARTGFKEMYRDVRMW